MTTEACVVALKSTLEEIKNVCPQVSNTFIFKPDKTIIAQDVGSEENLLAEEAVEAFSILNKKAQAHGGLDSATFLGTDSQVKIVRANNMYFAVAATRAADEQILTVITRVLAPAILKTVQAVQPNLASATNETASAETVEIKISDEAETNPAESSKNTKLQETIAAAAEPYLPDAPVTQFMVDTLQGFTFIGSSDCVRIDNATIETWKTLFEKKKIEEVQIEDTRTGKKLRFKFKPIKDQKLEGKGVIQMPEKALHALKTKKGALVMVKPIVE